jgi:4a-hydroxytetrahydrobiopterin dehydratase
MLRRTLFRLAPPVKLRSTQVEEELKVLSSGWRKGEDPTRDTITKTFLFKDFKEAWAFMNSLYRFIDETDHHPEWFNVYNKVQVTLSTHDCQGLSVKDFRLAYKMEEHAKPYHPKSV